MHIDNAETKGTQHKSTLKPKYEGRWVNFLSGYAVQVDNLESDLFYQKTHIQCNVTVLQWLEELAPQ